MRRGTGCRSERVDGGGAGAAARGEKELTEEGELRGLLSFRGICLEFGGELGFGCCCGGGKLLEEYVFGGFRYGYFMMTRMVGHLITIRFLVWGGS